LAAFTTASSTNQPVGNNDLTTKLYVDSLALGISWKQPVIAATTANITLSGLQTIDTVSVLAGERVLVKNQTNQAENGIYDAAVGAWSRSPDANTWDELISALVFIVEGGQAGAAYYCPIQPGGTLGVTAITWNNFSVGGVYFAGTGLNLSGGDTFNISNTTVAAASYGSASAVPTFTVNAQGQLTAAANTNIAIGATQITSGTIDSARLSGSYSGITGVGTLTDLTVSNTITGSISGNAATATTATSATSATTATNLAGGAAGSVPYQSGAGATTFLAAGTNGQVLTIAGGVPSYATPTTGTVTSVATAGTVNGLTLTGGPITGSGTVTLGGTLDLSAPPTIGNTTANTIAGTTVTASTSFASPILKATSSAGGTLQNASGAAQMQWGSGGGNNLSLEVATNINPANAAVSISPTGTGTVAISPAGALTINPTTASTMNNVAIGSTTAAAAKVTTLDISSTLALAGSTGTAGYVLTSNGVSAPTWQVNSNGVTITDDTTTNATRYLTFSELTTGTETTLDVSSTKLQFNPSTGFVSSTGLITGAGTVSAPAITTTGDTNTGIFFPAADTIAFTEGGVESMRIDSSGNVGINNSSPTTKLGVTGAAQFIGVSPAVFPTSGSGIEVVAGVAGQTNYIQTYDRTGSAWQNLIIGTNNTIFETAGTERMRIASTGFVSIGGSSTVPSGGAVLVSLVGSRSGGASCIQQFTYNGGTFGGSLIGSGSQGGGMEFFTFTGALGSETYSERMRITSGGEVYIAGTADQGAYNLQCNGTGVWGAGAYVNGSDARIKENIAPINSGLDVVAKLNPVTYRYKQDWSKDQSTQTGFIAQELLTALEGEVYVDGVVQQGGEYMSVAYQNIIPILTKAIQELNAKVEAQAAEIALLKSK
jgi:hypothetical protein